LNPNTSVFFPSLPQKTPFKKKCPDVQKLQSYSLPPDPKFWENFPKRQLPSDISTPINILELKNLTDYLRHDLTLGQSARADLLISELTLGSLAPLETNLAPIRVQNTHSAVLHGEEFTDTVGHWIRQGYVAGPFHTPPFPDFRSNSMIAVEQKDKVRIIMDLSSPKNESFNDNINTERLEKVNMSTA